MHNLTILANYNTTLFAFVDALSQWNTYVGKHIHKYFLADYYWLLKTR